MPGYMPVFYFRTCDVTGKIEGMVSSDGNEVQMAMPGDNITCTCELIAAPLSRRACASPCERADARSARA